LTRQHRYGVQILNPSGPGELIDVGRDAVQDRHHPRQVDRHQRPLRAIAARTQVNRWRVVISVQAGQPAGALPEPARLIGEPVRDGVPAVQRVATRCIASFAMTA